MNPIIPPHKNTSHHTASCLHSPPHPIYPRASGEVLCDQCINLSLSEQKRRHKIMHRQLEKEKEKSSNEKALMELQKEKEQALLKKRAELETMKLNVSPTKSKEAPLRSNQPMQESEADIKRKRRASQKSYKEELDRQVAAKSKNNKEFYKTSLEGFSEPDKDKTQKLTLQAKESWVENIKKSPNKKNNAVDQVGYIFRDEKPHIECNLSKYYDEDIRIKKEKKDLEKFMEREYIKATMAKATEEEKAAKLQKERDQLKSREICSNQKSQAEQCSSHKKEMRKSYYEWGSPLDECDHQGLSCSKCKRPIKAGLY